MSSQSIQMSDECPICSKLCESLYSISQCHHRFCLDCCIGYLQCKSNSFETVRCMQQNCKLPLSKSSYPYQKLQDSIKFKIEKLQKFVYIQSNKNLKSCQFPQCQGIINIQQKKDSLVLFCDKQRHAHCQKCFKLAHSNHCKSQENQLFLKLNLKSCPKCSMWIEKIKGCQYIDCKCGITFCYRCGEQYFKDPCRKTQVWKNQDYTRKLLKRIKIKGVENSYGYITFIPILILKLLFVLIWTILCCLIALTIYLIFFGVIMIILVVASPLVTFAAITQQNKGTNPCCLILLTIILYPIILGLMLVISMFLILLYPFCRRFNFHGMFDYIDQIYSKSAIVYLSFLVCLLQF